jgi:hypothetical protein
VELLSGTTGDRTDCGLGLENFWMSQDSDERAEDLRPIHSNQNCWAKTGFEIFKKLALQSSSGTDSSVEPKVLTQSFAPQIDRFLEESRRKSRARKAAQHRARGAARDKILALLDGLGSRVPTPWEIDRLLWFARAGFEPGTCAARLIATLAFALRKAGNIDG